MLQLALLLIHLAHWCTAASSRRVEIEIVQPIEGCDAAVLTEVEVVAVQWPYTVLNAGAMKTDIDGTMIRESCSRWFV